MNYKIIQIEAYIRTIIHNSNERIAELVVEELHAHLLVDAWSTKQKVSVNNADQRDQGAH
jgi:hypothetical protein